METAKEKNVGRGRLKIVSPTNKASGRPSLSCDRYYEVSIHENKMKI